MTDAFDVLLAPTDPIQPSARFAADLRAQLIEVLAETPTQEETMSTATASVTATATRTDVQTVTAYLIVKNAAAVLDFYRDAFGAVIHHRLLDEQGRVGHAELTIGNTRVQLADEHPEYGILGPESRGGTTCSFSLEVPDVDAAFARAVELGATVRTPPTDQFHGNRTANIADPAGQQWMLLAPIGDLSAEEYAANAAERGYTVEGESAAVSHEADSPERHQLKRHQVGDLYYFNIPVADPARAWSFFNAVLGWNVHDGHIANITAPPGSIGNYYTVDSGGIRMWFVVEDIHASVAKVRELGGTAEEPSYSESGWSAECRDDQGTLFCLSVPSDAYSL